MPPSNPTIFPGSFSFLSSISCLLFFQTSSFPLSPNDFTSYSLRKHKHSIDTVHRFSPSHLSACSFPPHMNLNMLLLPLANLSLLCSVLAPHPWSGHHSSSSPPFCYKINSTLAIGSSPRIYIYAII